MTIECATLPATSLLNGDWIIYAGLLFPCDREYIPLHEFSYWYWFRHNKLPAKLAADQTAAATSGARVILDPRFPAGYRRFSLFCRRKVPRDPRISTWDGYRIPCNARAARATEFCTDAASASRVRANCLLHRSSRKTRDPGINFLRVR